MLLVLSLTQVLPLLSSHQVQDMIKMLGTEKHSDTDSLTDSGKGPSEHGEDGIKRKHKHNQTL